MKKLMIILLLGVPAFLGAQETERKNSLELNSIMNFGEMEYGLQLGYNRQITKGKKNIYSLNYGGYEELVYTIEPSTDGGEFGNSLSNQLGVVLTHQFNFLKSRKLYVSNSIYAGWGYRRTKLNLVDDTHGINVDYNEGYHYLAVGMYWKAGYMLNEKWGMQAIVKTDFSRLVDQYRPIFFEKPGPMIGIGVTYRF